MGGGDWEEDDGDFTGEVGSSLSEGSADEGRADLGT